MMKWKQRISARFLHLLFDAVRTFAIRRSSAEIMAKNNSTASKFLKDRGVGKGKLLLRSFLSPRKNIKPHNPAFSLAQEAQRKSLAKRKRRFMGLLAPSPRKFFEKNLTKNFYTLVQCEHCVFDR